MASIAIDVGKTPAKTLTPVVKSIADADVGHSTYFANAKAARLNWQSSNQDQIVVGYDGLGHSHLAFYRINNDSDLSITQISDSQINQIANCGTHQLPGTSLRDIAIGNYDQLDSSGEIEIPGKLQISVLYANWCTDSNPSAAVLGRATYEVDLDTGDLTLVSGAATFGFSVIPPNPDEGPPAVLREFPAALTAGDFQGRSLLLGALPRRR